MHNHACVPPDSRFQVPRQQPMKQVFARFPPH
jgi:hypothetical protein